MEVEIENIAGKFRRAVNLAIDSCIQLILLGTVYVYLLVTGNETYMLRFDALSGFISTAIVYVIYYGFFECVLLTTPAKWITSTRTVRTNGKRPARVQMLGRAFARALPFEALSYLVPGEIGLHDLLSDTRVVHVDRDNRSNQQGTQKTSRASV